MDGAADAIPPPPDFAGVVLSRTNSAHPTCTPDVGAGPVNGG